MAGKALTGCSNGLSGRTDETRTKKRGAKRHVNCQLRRIRHVRRDLRTGRRFIATKPPRLLVNPSVADAHLFESPAQLVLGAVEIPVGIESRSKQRLLIFVELGSQFVFGKLVRTYRNPISNIDIQIGIAADFQYLLTITKRLECHSYYQVSLRKYHCSPFPDRKRRITYHYLGKRCLDCVSAISRRIQGDLIGIRSEHQFSGTTGEVGEAVLSWTETWNLSQTSQQFPSFGRSPATILGLSDTEVRSYLKRAMFNNE